MYLVSLCGRQVRRQFGGFRPFLVWVVLVTFIIYTMDNLLFWQPNNDRTSSAKKTKGGVVQIDLLEGKGFLLADDGKNVQDKKIEPAVPDEKEDDEQNDKEEKKENKVPKKANPDAVCGLTKACAEGHYAYYISSGYGRNISAKICFNGDELISAEQQTSHRGLNIVVINERTLNVDDIQIFDVYFTDTALMEYLRENMRRDQIFFVASQDEASYSLMKDARKSLKELLGSTIVSRVGFRDNYVIIGKQGLPSGGAIEDLRTRVSGNEYADQVSLSGCLAVPFKPKGGNIPVPVQAASENRAKQTGIQGGRDNIVERQPGTEYPNCGSPKRCTDYEFPVRLYTGTQNKDPPKICVDGNNVMTVDRNGAGRGLNFVVVNSDTKEVVRVARFDTFASDNVAMEMFLELLEDNELLLAVAYDEAAEKLDKPAKLMLEGLGSSFIRMIGFRDVWAFVGQKGIQGFSPLEEYSPSQATKTNLLWPKPIDIRMCVPTHLKALNKRQYIRYNFKRKTFCQTAARRIYGDFCNASVVDEPLWPVELSDSDLTQHPIYKVPIVVIAGTNHNAVRLQLEGLFSNPGISREQIMIFHHDRFRESSTLAKVFDVDSTPISILYSELTQKAFLRSWELFPHADYIIFLDEEVIPSADFLNFFRQCFDAMASDKTLIGISAWNPYGYAETSNLTDIAYRADVFPGLGSLIKRTVYEKTMRNKMTECCSARSWEGWSRPRYMQMIISEVSRVTGGKFGNLTTKAASEFNQRRRATVGAGQYNISMAESLSMTNYDNYLRSLLRSAKSINTLGAERCLADKKYTFQFTHKSPSSVNVIYYDSGRNNAVLHRLISCFQLGSRAAISQHRALLRLSVSGRTVLMVSSSSSFYRGKPASVSPLNPTQLKN